MRACACRGCVNSVPQKLTFSPQVVFHGQPSPESAPHYSTTRFRITQVRTCAGDTFRDVCAHVHAGGVSTRPLRNSLFPHRRFFHGQPSPESAPPLPALHCFASCKFVLGLEKLSVMFARMPKPGVCLLGPSHTHFFPTGGFSRVTDESDPHCPHYTVLHRTSSYMCWRNFS